MTVSSRTPGTRTVGPIIQINLRSLQAFAFGVVAWWLWPDAGAHVGWALIAGMFALVAIACAANALNIMVRLYRRDREIAAFVAQGDRPKASTLASGDALDQAGMR